MKKCYTCKKEVPLEGFHKNSSKPDGLQGYCKECAKIRNARYYRETPEKNSQRTAASERMRRDGAAWVLAHKLSHPCVDCGETDPVVLDFDHVRGKKVSSISKMVHQASSIARISAEAAKCEVRCANCHRRVTHARRVVLA